MFGSSAGSAPRLRAATARRVKPAPAPPPTPPDCEPDRPGEAGEPCTSRLSDDPPPFLLSGELVLPPLPPDPLPSEGPFPEAVDPPPPPPPPPPGPPGPPPPDAFELLSAPMSRCTSLS